MALTLIITNAGRAAIIARGGTNAVQIVSCGISGTPVEPDRSMTALPGETKRIATISGQAVGPDTIHMVVRDETPDVYTVRSLGLYLGDGTLFAIYGQAAPILEKAASSVMLLAVDVTFADIVANQITLGSTNFLNPPATTTTQGVVELATDAEAVALVDAVRALTPKNMAAILTAASVLSRLITVDGAGSGLDADLLDGRQGEWYADIASRLGYAPANRAGDRFTGPVTFPNATYYTETGSTSSSYQVGTDTRYYVGTRDNYFYMGFNGNTFSGSRNGFVVDFNGVGYVGNNMLMHTGNDGAGSGFDADLLDGQQGSFYTNIAARLGYTPANKAGDTFTGPVTFNAPVTLPTSTYYSQTGSAATSFQVGAESRYWMGARDNRFFMGFNGQTFSGAVNGFSLDFSGNGYISDKLIMHLGNDGAGSGFDADLLDGREGAYYADIVSRLGYRPVQQGGGAGQGNNDVRIGWSGARLKAQVDNDDQGSFVFDKNIPEFFTTRFLGGNGYQVFPAGLIVQWVRGSYTTGEATQTLNFPTTFPNACVAAQVSDVLAGPGGTSDAVHQLAAAPGNASVVVQRNLIGTSDTIQSAPWVLAIGY